jgi:glycosyltransferase involved in cell wall biosynthesis
MISVVIPTYNSDRTLEVSVRSVLAQSVAAAEIVISDNASTDQTLEIAEWLAEEAPQIRILRNPTNSGPVNNWIRGLREARCECAALLFSDDWYEEDFLASMRPFLSDPGVGFAFCAARRIVEQNGTYRMDRIIYKLDTAGRLASAVFLNSQLYGRGRPVPVSPACALFRREDLIRALCETIPDTFAVGHLAHGAGPDLLCYLAASVRYPFFAHVQEPLVNLRDRADALSRASGATLGYTVARVYFAQKHRDVVNVRKANAWSLYTLLLILRRDPRARLAVERVVRGRQIDWIYFVRLLFEGVGRAAARRLVR